MLYGATLYRSQTWATRKEYNKIGGLRNVNMEKNGKEINCTEHNNKLRSAGNDWRRKSPDAGRHQQ